MKQPPNIFLVGPMGAGKSAVGRQLARALRLDFVDSDDEIEARTGVDIAFIFEKEGEAGFRKREAAAIDDLAQRPGMAAYHYLHSARGELLHRLGRDDEARHAYDQALAMCSNETERRLLSRRVERL